MITVKNLRNSSFRPAHALSILALGLLQACSGGSGGGGSERPVDVSAGVGSAEFVYNGAAPASDEIQNFKVSLYDALAGNDRCGECHTPGGPGTTHFADQTNVNTAWQEAKKLVDLGEPADSALVSRVANGHNCWLGAGQEATCAITVTGYIERWAATAITSSATVQLAPRDPIAAEGTKVLPSQLADVDALGLDTTSSGELLDLVQTYCVDCHSDTAVIPQVPFFASASSQLAYTSLRGTIDLIEPSMSRLVLRLDPESHNCWSGCSDNASEMEAAIARLADVVPETDIDPALKVSTAQVLERDGIIATSGGRFEANLVAKWEFREGSGNTTADTSGVPPEIPLSLSGEYSWEAGWGIRFVEGKAQGGVSGSSKLFDKIAGTGEYSIEAWVAPANVSQEEAWIVAYAGGPENRNLLLSQSLYNYEAFNRSTVTEDNNGGAPALATDDDAELAQASLQHVVVTYSPIDGRRLYVNGIDSGDVDAAGGGLLNNWSEAYAVVLGNTTSNANPWAGTMRMVAIHNSTLTPAQVEQNFDIGVGQKYFLLFSVAEILDREGGCHVIEEGERVNYCYVVFEVSQFDGGSYLFNEPFFANINPNGGNVEFSLKGIRLGINGKLAEIGQAFVNVNAQIAASNLGDLGQQLASIGSIISLENGADQDVFFLAFDDVDGQQGSVNDGAKELFSATLNGEPSADIGMRTFDEINATLSRLTGVPVSSASVSNVTGKTVGETFNVVRRALPSVADFQAYQSSHQMAATQLAAAYCDALVQDVNLRENIFPSPSTFDFNTPVADPGIDWRNHVVIPIVDRAINTGLLSAGDRSQIVDEVELLITDDRDLKPYIFVNGNYVSDPNPAVHNKRDGLIYCLNGQACPATRTADVVKASCTAVLGSAVVLMQ
jgi:hypothetical protein